MRDAMRQPGWWRQARRRPPQWRASRVGARALLCAAALLSAAHNLLGDTITLRSTARVEALASLRLGDVTDLDGAYAAEFRNVALDAGLLRRSAAGPLTLDIAAIRRALDEAKANWGRLSLRGDVCAVRERRVSSGPAVVEPSAEPVPARIDPDGPPTLRLRVALYVSEWTGLPLDRLRLTFSEQQQDVLALLETEHRFELTPITSADSLRIPVVVRIWRDGVPLRQETISVDLEKHVPVVVLKRDVERDEALTAADVEVQTIWLSRSGPQPYTGLAEVAGRVAVKRLQAGKLLRAGDLEQPILINRRDKVRVYCLVGNLVLSTDTARALEEGRLGEWIQLQREGGRRTFSAKVQGRGVALVELSQPLLGGAE